MFGLRCVEGELALVEVGNQRAVAEGREPFCHAFDLIVQTPPFLDDDHARGLITARRTGEIAVTIFSIGPLESHHLSHSYPPLLKLEAYSLLCKAECEVNIPVHISSEFPKRC